MSLREEIKDSLSYFGATEQEKADEIINKVLDAAVSAIAELPYDDAVKYIKKYKATVAINKLRGE